MESNEGFIKKCLRYCGLSFWQNNVFILGGFVDLPRSVEWLWKAIWASFEFGGGLDAASASVTIMCLNCKKNDGFRLAVPQKMKAALHDQRLHCQSHTFLETSQYYKKPQNQFVLKKIIELVFENSFLNCIKNVEFFGQSWSIPCFNSRKIKFLKYDLLYRAMNYIFQISKKNWR